MTKTGHESKLTAKAVRQQAGSGLPDLYGLLRLEPLESDRARIEAALRQVIEKAKEDHSKDAVRRAQRLLQLGKANLLNSERKQAYDARWKSVFGPALQAPEPANWSTLEAILPSGDPQEPFDLSEYLKRDATDPVIDTEAEFQALLALCKPDSAKVPASNHLHPDGLAPDHPLNQRVAPPRGPVQANKPLVGAVTAPPVNQSAASIASSPPEKPSSIAIRIRQKSGRSIFQYATGLLLSLICVMGVLFAVMKAQSPSVQPIVKTQESTVAAGSRQAVTPVVDPPRRGSGLPEVSGLDDASRIALAGSARTASLGPQSDDVVVKTADLPSETADSKVAYADAGGNSPTMTIARDSALTGSQLPDVAATPDAPELSEEQQAAWSTAMNKWRSQLVAGDFAGARNQQQAMTASVLTPLQQQQLNRLTVVAALAEQFEAALRAAVSKLGAGDAFQVSGPSMVGFVEGDERHVVLRISGRNKSFAFNELPLGIAFGLAELELDVAHPTTLAKKAAYGWLHAQPNNSLALEDARNWMASAEADGAVPAGTTEVFQDDYGLQ